MAILSGSVGSRARNRATDVLKVQKLLNEWFDNLSMTEALIEDGLAGRKTMLAIVEFQGRVVGMAEPDGRIDPGGLTWKTLTRKIPTFKLLSRTASGFYTYAKDKKRHGTSKTIASIKRLGKALDELDLIVGVGNISLKNGGPMAPHTSHQRGVDVDFRPMRKDARKVGVTIHDPEYSQAKTRKLVKAIRQDTNLDLILFNDPDIPGITFWTGHDNHLHVRYKA